MKVLNEPTSHESVVLCCSLLFCPPFYDNCTNCYFKTANDYDNCTNCQMIMSMMGVSGKVVARGMALYKSNSHFCRQPFYQGRCTSHFFITAGILWSHWRRSVMIMSDVFKVGIIWKIEPILRQIVCDCFACWCRGKDKGRYDSSKIVMLLLLSVKKNWHISNFAPSFSWVIEYGLLAMKSNQGWHGGWW